ncbi:cyclodeaminase/cyclohydrolase family protein [Nesterenkonia sp. Act20]|uniref:cyclodeaminase/cyclohydrolase family protein n=1 Tax=Nesterenkonia sp. Act20 TaxID=1483432 RepID=UPI001C43D8D2|nr:cyclodeaminase/cyclohydrolase family protein [Nesterenkonia sp. Act20]
MADAAEITTQDSTLEKWTRALAEPVGSPGGGAGAGVMFAIAASLTSMVGGYTEPTEEQRDVLDAVIARAQKRRQVALQLADEDAEASKAFGAAFAMERGAERRRAIRDASLGAARSSVILGEHAAEAIDDLCWLAEHGNSALIADVVVAFGALRAAVTGARTNASFDLAALKSSGSTLEQVQNRHPKLWASVEALDSAIVRIDAATAAVDDRAAPTDA